MIWTIMVILLIWTKISIIRMFMLMGQKDHKYTFTDKVMLAPVSIISFVVSALAKKD